MGKTTNKKQICVLFVILALIFVGIVSLGNSHSSPNAFINACSKMGSNMGRVSPKNDGYVRPELEHRKWTVEELFRKSVKFTTYYGEGEGTWLYAEKDDRGAARAAEVGLVWPGDIQSTLESARGFGTCTFGGGDFIPNGIMSISGGVVNLINTSISGLIGEDFMVGGLAKIVGGSTEDNTGGLIETFVNSLYMPLIVIIVILATITVVYQGLVQMKMREALNNLIWMALAFIIGLALMYNPQMLAGAPQKATSTITTCVLGALNGQNCLTGEVEAPSALTGKECKSYSKTDSSEGNNADLMVNGMTCTIWKTFILEPWAEEQFGAPYNKLYTRSSDIDQNGGSLWSGLTEDTPADLYCVNMMGIRSIDESLEKGILMNSGDNNSKVCNVALYQLYLKTEMTDPSFHQGDGYNENLVSPDKGDSYDQRWYDIIIPMASSPSWTNWSGQGRMFARLGSSFVGLIAVIAASIALITLSILGAAYKIIGVVLMAFAPLFFLLAIEPSRGRKMFLGWLETLVSSILKYFTVTMLIVVALVLYAGLLANTTGVASLITVIILTVTLGMYRKEIIDIIGASNMGGKRLSNRFGKVLDKRAKGVKEKSRAVAGGMVGGAVGAMQNRKYEKDAREDTLNYLKEQLAAASTPEKEEFYKDEIKKAEAEIKGKDLKLGRTIRQGASSGGGESFARAMRRGASATATAFRQANKTGGDLKSQTKKQIKEAAERRQRAVDKLNEEKEQNEAVTVDSLRKPTHYKGNLTDDELANLEIFRHHLANTDDEQLINLADIHGGSKDENRSNLVKNELNARLDYKQRKGEKAGKLGRHILADQRFVSLEEQEANKHIIAPNPTSAEMDDMYRQHQIQEEKLSTQSQKVDLPKLDKQHQIQEKRLSTQSQKVDLPKLDKQHQIQEERLSTQSQKVNLPKLDNIDQPRSLIKTDEEIKKIVEADTGRTKEITEAQKKVKQKLATEDTKAKGKQVVTETQTKAEQTVTEAQAEVQRRKVERTTYQQERAADIEDRIKGRDNSSLPKLDDDNE